MAAAPLALEAGRRTFENLTPEQLDELRRSGVLPYSAGETYARPSPSGSITATAPGNPVDRYLYDSDWYRSLKPEAQHIVGGAAELAPPVAAARGGYDIGAGAASGSPGQFLEGVVNAVPEVGPAAKAAVAGVALPAIRKAAKAAPSPAEAIPALERIYAPAVHGDPAEAATRQIFEHAAKPENLTPKYPTAKEPVFVAGEDAGRAATLERVPQTSRRGELPAPPPGMNEPLPLNDRARIIQDKAEEIGEGLAKDMRDAPSAKGKPREFYYTGPVLEGMENKAGLSPGQAREFMEDWSGQGAATSPRTKTPSNLRNASYLLYRAAQGDPLTAEKRALEGNRPGFPMMDMHAELADKFAHGDVNPWQNPKPYTFQGNWAGNLQDVTGDTHYIRGVLSKLDELYPGNVPKEWFSSDEAYKTYKKRGGFAPGELPVGDINDKLQSAVVGAKGDRRKAQIEYGIMTDPGYIAARQLGVAPAEAQSQMWFHYGDRTGLRSPAASIPDLLNSQIEETARATGLHPEKILQFWTRGRIPLAANESSTAVG